MSIRTVNGSGPLFKTTISDAHPPPATNCGKSTASRPPTEGANCGSGVVGETLVMGMVLNVVPLNSKAMIAIGVFEVIVRVPAKSGDRLATPAKKTR